MSLLCHLPSQDFLSYRPAILHDDHFGISDVSLKDNMQVKAELLHAEVENLI